MPNERLDPRLFRKPAKDHQDYSPRQQANRRKAARTWWRKHARETAWPRSRRSRGSSAPPELAVVTAATLKRPHLLWLDENGRLHREEELSAEELIRRWQATQKPSEGGKEAHEEEEADQR